MDAAAEALLIIVSTVLSVFLIVAAIALLYAISLLRQIKRIVQRAENLAETVESAAMAFEKSAGPLAVVKLVSNIVEQVSRLRRKKGKG